MSRSFKKTPIAKDNKSTRKEDKRLANRKVRRTPLIGNGKQYRKVYNSWDIYDYVFRVDSWRDVTGDTEFEQQQTWAKYYKRK